MAGHPHSGGDPGAPPRQGVLLAKRFLILLGLLVVYSAFLARWAWPSPGRFLIEVAEQCFVHLPIVAGIVAGLSHKAGLRNLVRLLVGVVILMAFLDMVPPLNRPNDIMMQVNPAAGTVAFQPVQQTPSTQATHALLRIAAYLAGDFPGVDQVPPNLDYPLDHPRWVVTTAFFRVSFFLLVPVIMGIVLGLTTWIESRLLFREPRDETVTFAAVSWLVAPAVPQVAHRLQQTAWVEVLFLQGNPVSMLFPVLLLGGLAAVGWWVTVARGP